MIEQKEVINDIIHKDYDIVLRKILKFIKKQARGCSVVIGLSGGIDSTLCAYLAYKALGKEKVHGVLSFSRYSDKKDVKDTLSFVPKICGTIINLKKRRIDKIRKAYDNCLQGKNENERITMDAYIRNNLLRRYSRLNGLKLLGTINGTEWRLGYYPKYALIGDFLPIADLFKTQVFELAEYLGVPREILEKKPTLDLSGLGCSPVNEKDKSKIDIELMNSGLSYTNLDIILAGIDNNLHNRGILDEAKKEKMKLHVKQIKIVRKLVLANKHKIKLPPYPKINLGTPEWI